MKKRIASTLILWSLLIFGLVYGGPGAGLIILLFFSLLAQYEFYLLIEKFGYACFKFIGLVAGAVLLIGAWFQRAYVLDISLSVLALTVSFLSIIQLLIHLPKKYGNPLPGTLWGILYIPFMLQFYARLIGECRAYEPTLGIHLVLWSIAIAKFTDVGALLAGKCLGKHLMAPQISPKKTWEGLLGGLIMGTGVGVAFQKKFGYDFIHTLTLAETIGISLCISFVSVFSDLIESGIKRQANVKDSSQIIPGIGGAFDLVDSLILVAPVSYGLFHYYKLVF